MPIGLNVKRRTFQSVRLPGLLLVLTLLFPVGMVTAYQSGTEAEPYRAELLDWSIVSTGPNYVLENVAIEEYPHGQGERVYITHVESLGFVELSFFDDEDTPEETIELMLRDFRAASDSLEVLDTGVRDDVHFALARFDLGSRMFGYFYIEVMQDIEGGVDFAQSIYTLDTDFLEQVEIARDEIAVNGHAFLSEPVIDLDTAITADIALLASTPEPIATPDRGDHTFDTNDTLLVVDAPIEYDFPLSNNQLEVMFLESEHGYGIVGFIHDDMDSAEAVMSSIFVGAPAGQEAPLELYLESNEYSALGVYRVHTQGERRAMVIEIGYLDDELWTVQAMAVTESEFETEFHGYQQGVTFDGDPFLHEIEVEAILTILEDS